MKLRSVGSLQLLLAILLATPGCQPPEAAGDPGADNAAADSDADGDSRREMRLPVVGRVARRGDLVLSVSTTGQVRSDAVTTLKAESAGTVEDVLVRPGQRVARGQTLLRLDSVPFVLEVERAQAEVDQAYLQYQDYLVPDSIVTGEPPSEVKKANAAARSGLQAARVRLRQAEIARERAVITAPFAGVADLLQVSPGERVSQGEDLVTLVDVTNLWVEASVLEHDLPLIKSGGQALVTTAAFPDEQVTGRIEALLPLVDSTTRAGRALVRIRGDGRLRPGMYADVALEATRLVDRLLVPSAAVIERDGRPLVFVVRDGRAQWVYVTPGRSNGEETEIMADEATGEIPLQPGETVLIEGHLTLTHDAPVTVVGGE